MDLAVGKDQRVEQWHAGVGRGAVRGQERGGDQGNLPGTFFMCLDKYTHLLMHHTYISKKIPQASRSLNIQPQLHVNYLSLTAKYWFTRDKIILWKVKFCLNFFLHKWFTKIKKNSPVFQPVFSNPDRWRGLFEMYVQATLEGHQRAIMGNMSVEQIYRDRQTFSTKVISWV